MKDPTSTFFPCLEGLVQIEMLVEKSRTASYTCSRKHWSTADIYKDDSTWVEKEKRTKGFRLSAWFYAGEVFFIQGLACAHTNEQTYIPSEHLAPAGIKTGECACTPLGFDE